MTKVDLETDLVSLRRTFENIQRLSDASWEQAKPLFSYQQFNAGEHIFKAGDVVSNVYFQTSGLTRFYYLHENGKEFNKSFAAPNQVVSSIFSLVTGKASAFNVQALTKCNCVSIAYTALLELARTHADWNRISFSLLELLAIKKEQREADFLLLNATQRYENFKQEYAPIIDSIANYHIASYLGITEVALSRIRKRLKLT